MKEKCQKGVKGDFIFYQQGNQIVYISIYDQTDKSIVFEQIHTTDLNPELQLEAPINWIKKGAKGASQWILYELDLENGEVLEAFSPPKRGFISFGNEMPLLSKFFLVAWEEMPDSRRKRLPKTNKIWSPQKKILNAPVPLEKSALWRHYWPKDESALSGLRIDLHLDPETNETFPYMIDIQNKIGPLARFQQIDQGKGAPPCAKYFPRRHPDFGPQIRQKGDILHTTVTCGKGFYPFQLFLEEVDTHHAVPVTFESEKKDETYQLKILIPAQVTKSGKKFRLLGKTTGIHQSRFDSIEVFELN